MVERTREQLKYTYLHLFVNRQSKNSLADVVLLTQIRNHGGTFTFLAFAYETDFFSPIQWMNLQFPKKIAMINEALLFCYSFEIRQSFFDNKEFLKKFASYHGPLFSSCR